MEDHPAKAVVRTENWQFKQEQRSYDANLLIKMARIPDNYCNPDATIICSKWWWLYWAAGILWLSEGNMTLVIHHTSTNIQYLTTYATQKIYSQIFKYAY